MIHDILLYCTLHMQGLWSFSFLGCSSWLLLCRLHVWWGMWRPTRGFFQRRRIMSHSAAGTSNVTWYRTRGLDISSEMWSLRYCTVQLKMKRSSQSKVYEKDVWDIQVDGLSETRYTVSVFDVKRLNPSLSWFDLIWFDLSCSSVRLQVRGVFEFSAWLLRIPNSPSYIHGPTYTDHDTVLSQAVLYHTLYYL